MFFFYHHSTNLMTFQVLIVMPQCRPVLYSHEAVIRFLSGTPAVNWCKHYNLFDTSDAKKESNENHPSLNQFDQASKVWK